MVDKLVGSFVSIFIKNIPEEGCKIDLSKCGDKINIKYSHNPSAVSSMWPKIILKWNLIELNSEFYFAWANCHAKVKDPSLPFYLPITQRRIFQFIAFPRVLALCGVQAASSCIWTCLAGFISKDEKCYTTKTSIVGPYNISIYWYN